MKPQQELRRNCLYQLELSRKFPDLFNDADVAELASYTKATPASDDDFELSEDEDVELEDSDENEVIDMEASDGIPMFYNKKNLDIPSKVLHWFLMSHKKYLALCQEYDEAIRVSLSLVTEMG